MGLRDGAVQRRSKRALNRQLQNQTRKAARVKGHEQEWIASRTAHAKAVRQKLDDVGPILVGYLRHYQSDARAGAGSIEAGELSRIPLGSAIIALADLCERLSASGPQTVGGRRVSSIEDIPSLSGTVFPAEAVQALVASRTRPM